MLRSLTPLNATRSVRSMSYYTLKDTEKFRWKRTRRIRRVHEKNHSLGLWADIPRYNNHKNIQNIGEMIKVGSPDFQDIWGEFDRDGYRDYLCRTADMSYRGALLKRGFGYVSANQPNVLKNVQKDMVNLFTKYNGETGHYQNQIALLVHECKQGRSEELRETQRFIFARERLRQLLRWLHKTKPEQYKAIIKEQYVLGRMRIHDE